MRDARIWLGVGIALAAVGLLPTGLGAGRGALIVVGVLIALLAAAQLAREGAERPDPPGGPVAIGSPAASAVSYG